MLTAYYFLVLFYVSIECYLAPEVDKEICIYWKTQLTFITVGMTIGICIKIKLSSDSLAYY